MRIFPHFRLPLARLLLYIPKILIMMTRMFRLTWFVSTRQVMASALKMIRRLEKRKTRDYLLINVLPRTSSVVVHYNNLYNHVVCLCEEEMVELLVARC